MLVKFFSQTVTLFKKFELLWGKKNWLGYLVTGLRLCWA